MKVIGHSKAFWFLLEDQGRYYLDVNSGHSFVGYSIAFELNQNEIESYREGSDKYIDTLAHDVNNIQSSYLDRGKSLKRAALASMHKAIMNWKVSKDKC